MVAYFALVALAYYVTLVAHHARVIWHPKTGEPYLVRYSLFRSKRFRVFLHRILRTDISRDEHNHPWPTAFSVVLRGGYTEKIVELDGACRLHDYIEHTAPSVSYEAFEPGKYHRIVHVKPNTWQLLFAGRRARVDWGFLVNTTHVPWREHLGLPPEYELDD